MTPGWVTIARAAEQLIHNSRFLLNYVVGLDELIRPATHDAIMAPDLKLKT